MTTGIAERKGTIAYVFNEHMNELFELIENNKIKEARKLALELLDDNRITDKQAVIKAKQILSKANPNLFISTLMTYMTGLKVS